MDAPDGGVYQPNSFDIIAIGALVYVFVTLCRAAAVRLDNRPRRKQQ